REHRAGTVPPGESRDRILRQADEDRADCEDDPPRRERIAAVAVQEDAEHRVELNVDRDPEARPERQQEKPAIAQRRAKTRRPSCSARSGRVSGTSRSTISRNASAVAALTQKIQRSESTSTSRLPIRGPSANAAMAAWR